ncbi:hypothetical protein F53441_10887 [Fusarium austroafricanum]|uniref:Uncharacterized protein n=1 Tax=Fusarium austroafricanum TaxID=2364996 RepID=A0A8H4NU23_9HYPO|nr:hypothetical protein F53441_10887 [Fusarium austroafricanum]
MEPPYTQRSGVSLQTRPVLSPFNPSALQSLNSILPPKKNGISINIHDHYASKRYRPGSVVKGTVNIKPKKQTPFTKISIKFVCDSSVERPNANLSFETWHRLLDLEMPVEQLSVPATKVLQPNETYAIPFYFVLPNGLGTEACSHNVIWQETRELHSQLPPSITGWESEAMIPRGVRVEYGVIAQVWDSACPEYAKLEAKETVQFLPGFAEHPPLKIPTVNRAYKFQVSKQLKSSVFSRSSGEATLSAGQPSPLVLDTSGKGFHPMTVAGSLAIKPSDRKSALPQVCSISAKIESETWSQDEPMQQLPHIVNARDCYNSSETLLKKLDVDLRWERDALKQPDGVVSETAETFISQIEIPLSGFATDKKMFLPTFYSCLVARTYQLHLIINVASVALKLVLPIQFTMEDQEGDAQPDDSDIGLPERGTEGSSSLPSYHESERRHSRPE